MQNHDINNKIIITDDYINELRSGLEQTPPPSDPTAAAYAKLTDGLGQTGDDQTRLAAVLVPVIRREPAPTVLLTRRTDNLTDHAGQVSFPGGRVEAHDNDVVATALRETDEEIGIAANRIETLGFMAPYRTVTNFIIVPVVGLVEPGTLIPNPQEVAAIFEIPLDFLLPEPVFERKENVFQGRQSAYLVVNYKGETIWGATASILYKFRNLLT